MRSGGSSSLPRPSRSPRWRMSALVWSSRWARCRLRCSAFRRRVRARAKLVRGRRPLRRSPTRRGAWSARSRRLAIAAMFLVAGGSVLAAASQHRAAALLPALATPAFALGMNHPAPDGFKLAAVFLAGAAWTTLVNLLWPLPEPADLAQRRAAASHRRRDSPDPSDGAHSYARPLRRPPPQSGSRSPTPWTSRTRHGPARPRSSSCDPDPEPADQPRHRARLRNGRRGPARRSGSTGTASARSRSSVIAVCAVDRDGRDLAPAAGTSRAAGSGLVVLLISGVSSTQAFQHAFGDRIFETLLGAALALFFGVVVPRLLRAHGGDDPKPYVWTWRGSGT